MLMEPFFLLFALLFVGVGALPMIALLVVGWRVMRAQEETSEALQALATLSRRQ
ncbi:MAG: hypothetical protein ACYC4L_17230 [Chloroflexota bacterium]